MYRKYTLSRTHVINAHNYLLEAQQIDNKTQCLFHQVLVSPQALPSLLDHPLIEKVIADSENQNSINEVKGRFEFYLEQNLLQVRLKQDLKLISQLSRLPIRQVLKLIGVLNLDLLISVKQMRSMARHNQASFSNANKFFSSLILTGENNDLILPFIDGEQIHFYDVYYQESFGKNREKEKRIDDRMLKRRLSEKKLKKKVDINNEENINSDEVIFRRYMRLLVVLLSSKNIIQCLQEMEKNVQYSPDEVIKRIEKMQSSAGDRTEQKLLELLHKCVANEGEYNLNIFLKQCEILIDKHDKIQKSAPNQRPVESNPRGKEEKLKNSKSCLALNKQLRNELISSSHNDRPITRESEKRLKGSKSLINIKPNQTNTSFFPKNRSLKNSKGLFAKSKEKFLDKTNIFQQSWSTFSKQKAKASPTGVNQPASLDMAGTAKSNWFQPANENQSMLKLRNFKKSNNFANTASNTPHHQQFRSQAATHLNNTAPNEALTCENDKISESQLNRLEKMIRRQSFAKIEKEKQLDDKFTMTEQIEEKKEEVVKQEKSTIKPLIKREIVNTISFKFYEQSKKTIENQKIEISKHKNIEQPPKIDQKTLKNMDKRQIVTKQIEQKALPKEVSEPNNIAPKEMMKPKKQAPSSVKKPILDEEQFQQIVFSKKQPPKAVLNASASLKKANSALENQPAKLKPEPPAEPKQPLKPKGQKIAFTALPKTQKQIYIKHFVLFLKFYQENNSKIRVPQLNKFTYVINFLYFKTLLQNNNPQSNADYKKLIDLLCKKQQKFGQQDKNKVFLYRVSFDSLQSKVKAIQSIESNVAKGIQQELLKERVAQSKQQIEELYTLTCQANRLLESIYKQLSAFVLANKIVLIKSETFLTALQLVYLITLTMIISIQREKYYEMMLSGRYDRMADCFRFRYDKNEEEHLANYRKRIEAMDKISLSVQEECAFFQSQYDKYK